MKLRFLARLERRSVHTWFTTFVLTLIGYGTFSRAVLGQPGSLDPTFNVRLTNAYVYAVAVQPDQKILIGGSFSPQSYPPKLPIARLNSDGCLDPTFDVSQSAEFESSVEVQTIALQADGRILVGGRFATVHGVSRRSIARLYPDGSLDPDFDPGKLMANGEPEWTEAIRVIRVQPDGKILVGGHFQSVNGKPLVRLQPDGTLDPNFAPAMISAGGPEVVTLQLQDDGKILVGGSLYIDQFRDGVFTTQSGIARLNSDGSADPTFVTDSTADRYILSIATMALQPDGKVLIGGYFTWGFRGSGDHLGRLNADGTFDDTFNQGPGADGRIGALALQADGKIWAGGSFSSVNGTPRAGLVRLLPDGSVDADAVPLQAAGFYAAALVPTDEDRLFVGGQIFWTNGAPASGLAKVISGNPALSLPAILAQSTSQVVRIGNNATFTTRIAGYPLNIQWRKDGISLLGATNAILTLHNVSGDAAGVYRLTVSNLLGTVESEPATLTVAGEIEGINLISNPSFESLLPSLSSPGSYRFGGVAGWTNRFGLSPDIFAAPADVPVNYLGYQQPFHGSNYAGVPSVYRALDADTQYWTATLSGSLAPVTTVGQRYQLNAAFARSKLSPFAWSVPVATPFPPAKVEVLLVKHSEPPLLVGRTTISDWTDWTVFERVVVTAKSYDGILIQGYDDPELGLKGSYFYVDAVSLVPIPDSPLTLAPISNSVLRVREALSYTNHILNIDATDGWVVFSVDPGAPLGARVDPRTGVFSWQPDIQDSASTNQITIRASYPDKPTLLASQSFTIVVGDSVEMHLGSSVNIAQEPGLVPLSLNFRGDPRTSVTNLGFVIVHPAEVIDVQIVPLLSGLAVTKITSLSSTQTLVQLSASGPARLGMDNPAAELRFTTSPQQSSRFIEWELQPQTAQTGDGLAVSSLWGRPARSIVLGPEPILDASLSTEGKPILRIYGPPGSTCHLETRPAFFEDQTWSSAGQVSLTGLWESVEITNRAPAAVFYRAWR